MVTLKKLAKELNVSVSTVSKALRGSEEISKNTIKRVKELATLYNYKPNQAALNLKNSKTKTIGVIIPNILNHFFARVLYGIEKEATEQGYNIIICLSNESFEKEKNSLELLSNGSVDGFILSLAEETQVNNRSKHLGNIMDKNLPIVLFDRVMPFIVCDKIVVDDFEAAYQATKQLIKENRMNIALISNLEGLSVGNYRAEGYLKALEEAENYSKEPLVLNCNKSNDLEAEIDQFLRENKSIDGILSIDNTTGVLALNKVLELNYKVPKDLSIIGFSDKNVLQFTNPKLSTIIQHPIDIGKSAVKMAINRIESKVPVKAETKVIKTELILRETTL